MSVDSTKDKVMTPFRALSIIEGLEDAESDEQVLEVWQVLVDSGMLATLPGSLGRTARDLIEAGLISN
jgi:hypothetical protein